MGGVYVNPTLHGLSWERVDRGGYCLLFSREPALKLTDLVTTEWKMLSSCSIPGLLPLTLEETDMRIQLLYEFTGRRPVLFGGQPTRYSREEYARLLIGIVAVLENCAVYLLSPDRYVLDPAHVYLSGSLSEPELLYLPLRDMDQEPGIEERFRELAAVLWQHIDWHGEHEDRDLWEELQEADGYRAVKRILINSLHHITRSPVRAQAQPGGPGKREPQRLQPHLTPAQLPAVPSPPSPPSIRFDAAPLTSQSRPTRQTSAALIGVAALWLMYSILPEEGMLYISLGLSLLLLDLIYAWWKLPGPQAEAAIAAAEVSLESTLREDTPWRKYPELWPDQAMTPPAARIPVAEHYAASPDRTVLLPNQSQATVLLGKSVKTEPEEAYLEYKDSQSLSVTRLPIGADGLVLGRDSDSTPFMRDDRQVSRRHVELLRMDGGLLHLRDLGSKNGTRLNAEALIPYREYPLGDGDELAVADFCFRFVLPT